MSISKKRFLVLGGAGDMGSNAARYLYKLLGNKANNITIADYREDVAKEKANKIDAQIKVIKLDADNHEQLVDVLKNYDIVINCIGPNFKYAVKIAKAAIEAEINGVDICDDSEPTLKMYELNKEDPNTSNRVYIYGCGWTPGLTNISAKRSSEVLDSIHTISIAWTGDPTSEGLGVVEHMLMIITGNVPSFQNGDWVEVPAGKGVVKYNFPDPIGRTKVFDVGHPEPITIPRYITGLNEVTLKGAVVPYIVNTYLIDTYVKTGKTSTLEKIHESAIELVEGPEDPEERKAFEEFENSLKKVPSTYRVEALGEKNGKPASVIFSAAGGMEELTSLTAALAAVMIAEGKITAKGLIPPEACIPTEEFFQRYQKLGPKINIEWK
jgi:saccharopine dehydrogenase-like NADP-dependent oxidoreductase